MRRLATALGVEIELPAAGRTSTDDERDSARAETVALFRDLREPLGRYLASMGARQPEIEEIVQEAFLRLHKQLSTAPGRSDAPPQNLQGWVFRVAQNLLRDRRRGWHRRNVESI